MESFFVRYRNYVVLLAMLVAQVVGLAVQVRRTDAGRTMLATHDGPGVRLVRLWANALVSPPERQGFGAHLISQLTRQLGGEVSYDWRPTGLKADFKLKLA